LRNGSIEVPHLTPTEKPVNLSKHKKDKYDPPTAIRYTPGKEKDTQKKEN